jgi:C4-dicarboxylate-specific signal transduction histidine kinase
MTNTKALDHLNLCLKTARMGVWESTLSKEPLVGSDVKWDSEVRSMHGMPEDHNGDPMEWYFKYLHPDDLASVRERVSLLFENPSSSTKKIYSFTYRFRWPNGELHYIEMHASVEGLLSDERIKLYGVARDITQDVLRQKLIEDQKNRLLNASRMAVLGEISGGIAHEINNPLTVIQARSFQLQQMCESGRLDAAKIKSAAESISKTGDKIAKIIKSLRAFAQGQENEPVDKINLYELIQETLDFCRVRFYNHGIDVRVGPIPENLEFECRLVQIEEALLSIFNNAHDAIIGLSEKWILIEAFDCGHDVEIRITDSGQGICESIADKMMLPFFSTKEIGKGMGLGLCIASELINKHHGTLSYDRASQNTRFVISIPKKQP